MTLSSPTNPRPDWRLPILIEVGSPTLVSIRLRRAGVVLTPTSGTVNLYSSPLPSGSLLSSGVISPGTTSTATLTASGYTGPQEGLDTLWSAVVAGVTYTYRQAAAVVGYMPTLLLDDEDLYRECSELRRRERLPTGQTSWADQIEEAGYAVLAHLWQSGRRPWLSIDGIDLRELHLAESLARALGTVPSDAGTYFRDETLRWRNESARLRGLVRLTYDVTPDTHQSAGPIRCGSAGRARW
jgi:hypothetical protein